MRYDNIRTMDFAQSNFDSRLPEEFFATEDEIDAALELEEERSCRPEWNCDCEDCQKHNQKEIKMKLYNSIEEIKKQASEMLAQVDAVEKMINIDIPGQFVFSPPNSSRLCIRTIAELHEARATLREHFGWTDHLKNKFCSGGDVIVTYAPGAEVVLPLPFELWVEAPAEQFPKELLGECKLEKHVREEYSVICSVE